MSRTAAAAVAATVILAAAARPAAADPATRPAPRATAAELVDQLSADDPDARDAAAERLQDLPFTALPQVEAAAGRPDLPPEAAARLRHLMPVIRQRAKLSARREARSASYGPFYERVAVDGYSAGSHTDPKWDGAARTFLSLANRRYGQAGRAGADARRAAVAAFKAALAAGCDDPVVLACGGLLSADTRSPGAAADLFRRADAAAADGRCPPLFKFVIDGRMLRPVADLTYDQKVKVWKPTLDRLNGMIHGYKPLLALDGMPPAVAIDMATNLHDRAASLRLPMGTIVECVLTPLEQRFPNEAGVLALKGQVYIEWAWEARGGGWANTVTPQGWADMADRLKVARASLSRACDLDPDDAGPPTAMITVEMGQQNGRAAMEAWFDKAMAADPDDVRACQAKLLYLEPKWHGSADDLLAFGHQCADTGDWRTWIPRELVNAHRELAAYDPNPAAYWLRAGVWDDCRTVEAEYIKRYPKDPDHRNAMAEIAVKCRQWRAADEQFKALGDRADPSLFGNGSAAALDEARRTAARLADKPDEQGR